MRFSATTPLLLLFGTHLTEAFRPERHRECDYGSCRSGHSCQALEQNENCCPPRNGHAQHICGHGEECCGKGCCPEGWQCGANEKCYPPNATPSQQDDCLTTIVTVVKRGAMYPRIDIATPITLTDTTTPVQFPVSSTLTTETLSAIDSTTVTQSTEATTTTLEQVIETPTSTTALPTTTLVAEPDTTSTGPGTPTESETLSTTTAITSDSTTTAITTETASQTITTAQQTTTSANNPTGTVITEPDGQVTTVPPTTTTSSDYAGFLFPITTSISDTQPTDDGFVIPCGFWFFNACIGGIFGWHITIPPGIHPPGPPPSFKIDPEFPIVIDIHGNLPNWPGFVVGPDHVPTFSEEPTECETETAEMCVTSTSYGVSVGNGVTSTTATQVTSSCGTVYGCDVEDSATSVTDATTTTNAPEATMVIEDWEQWDTDETDAELEKASEQAESRLNADFGVEITSDTFSATPTPFTSTLTSEVVSTTTEISTTEINTPTTTEITTSTAEIISTTSLIVEPPTTTTAEELPTTTAAAEPIPNASLVRGPVNCHLESDFPGHADINGGDQDEFSTLFSGKTGALGTTMSPDSGPIEWNTQDHHGINYQYSASWVAGCITTVPTQDFQLPLGNSGIITAYLMVREDYTKCANGGVGGSTQVSTTVGCLKTTRYLYDLQQKHSNAPVVVASICSESTVISASLAQIQNLLLRRQDLSTAWQSQSGLAGALDTTLTGCMVLYSCLDDEVQNITSGTADASQMRWKARARAVWNEEKLQELLVALRGQQTAITLLIQLLQMYSA
ncbi:hypothetical protein G7Z17_g4720 [Cylindrodendrum hubeiense]|uniref:Uncharacterized protein n=1 Tax=Cylindrodendrum hubeiense TaxID=595255 RepID=A0A9P5LCE5_9HYPO|nr:hypothetical protein G7Z17_g4720 [Cylindrodendrum hubeiense]